jgi:hypothetical protein
LEEHVTFIFKVEEQARNQHEAGGKQFDFQELHGIISQKTELFITAAVKS